MQQLGSPPHDAVPLLTDPGEVAGDVDEDDERDTEGIAHPHEAGRLLRGRGVEAAAEPHRIVGDDAHGASAHATERRHDVGRPPAVQLLDLSLVEQLLDEGVDVVGPLGRLGQLLGQVDVGDRGEVEVALVAEQPAQGAGPAEGVVDGLGEHVDDPRAATVRLRSTETKGVDVLTRDRPDDVRPGDEDPPLRGEDDDVGECRPVGRATGGGADDDGDLGDLARGTGHDREDLADRVERDDPLGQARAARVPQAEDGHAVGEGPLVCGDDHLAPGDAHRAAHDRRVGGEDDDWLATDRAGRGEHARVVVLGDQLERALVEEGGQAVVGVARVLRAGHLDARADRGRGGVGLAGHAWLLKARATLCPPKPKELSRTSRSLSAAS